MSYPRKKWWDQRADDNRRRLSDDITWPDAVYATLINEFAQEVDSKIVQPIVRGIRSWSEEYSNAWPEFSAAPRLDSSDVSGARRGMGGYAVTLRGELIKLSRTKTPVVEVTSFSSSDREFLGLPIEEEWTNSLTQQERNLWYGEGNGPDKNE